MAIATFNPNPRPSPGAQVTPKLNLIENDLGNGYTFVAPKGLNHIKKEVSLSWKTLTIAQALVLDAFFVAQGGTQPFWYTLHGESVAKKWTCKSWNYNSDVPATFSATLVQNFSNIV